MLTGFADNTRPSDGVQLPQEAEIVLYRSVRTYMYRFRIGIGDQWVRFLQGKVCIHPFRDLRGDT